MNMVPIWMRWGALETCNVWRYPVAPNGSSWIMFHAKQLAERLPSEP